MRSIAIAILVFISFSSCVQKRYIHSAPPVLNPMFKEKGEAFAGVFYTSNGGNEATDNVDVTTRRSNGFAIQSGFSFTSHFGIAGSFVFLNQNDNYAGLYSDPFDKSVVMHDRTEYTLAGDYFFTNKEKKSGMNFLFGATLGKLKINDAGKLGTADYTRYFRSHSTMLFVEPCLNIYMGEHSGLGFSTKLNYVSYQNNQTNYSGSELATLRLDNTSSLYVAEFGIKSKIGFDEIPITVEPQFNYIWNHSGRIHVRRANFSIGVAYQFKHTSGKKH